MREKIHIDGIGEWNPVEEYSQIIWFWEQKAKNMSKSVATRFWLDMKELYLSRLMKVQAYELVSFLDKKASTEKEKRRLILREKNKKIAEMELKGFIQRYEKRCAIIKNICLN